MRSRAAPASPSRRRAARAGVSGSAVRLPTSPAGPARTPFQQGGRHGAPTRHRRALARGTTGETE